MQDSMRYMVVIKPDGKAHVVVLDRGAIDCERAEEIAAALGDIEAQEIVPDEDNDVLRDTHLDLDNGDSE